MGARTFITPQPGDTLDTIAERVLPGVEGAAQQLLSWNLHIAARGGIDGLLPSDIVFTEPPPAS